MAWTLRRRLTTGIVGLVAAVLVALSVLFYAGVQRSTWQQQDDALLARARAVAEIAEFEDGGYEMPLPAEPRAALASYVEAWKPDGGVLVRSTSLGQRDLPRTFVRPGGPHYADIVLPDGRDGRAVGLAFFPRGEHSFGVHPLGPCVLVLAEGIEGVEAALASVRTWFLVIGLGALLAVALITAWSLGRGLAPLARLAAEIEQVDDTRLATRLSLGDQPAELAVPIRKLNELLARLDASFARERQFTADVSHELRTPLAGLRTLLEVTALADRSTAEYRVAVADALAIVLQLGALVENLLTLARLDAGQVELDRRDLDLHSLVEECWRPHAKLAAARSIEFRNTVAPDVRAHSDREKLRIVVGNLLANAAEYTEHGGWIEVSTGADALLDITDSGPPLPADHLERVFDRLWRGDSARTATGVHCGIGLSLSRALCTSLSLSLSAASTERRTTFRITRATGN